MIQVQFIFCHKRVQTYLPFPRLIFRANYFCGPNSIPLHERILKGLCPFNPHLPWEHSKSFMKSRSHGVLCDLLQSLLLLYLCDYKACWLKEIVVGALPLGPKNIEMHMICMLWCSFLSGLTEVTWKSSLHAALFIQYSSSFRTAITIGYIPEIAMVREIWFWPAWDLKVDKNFSGNLVEFFPSWTPPAAVFTAIGHSALGVFLIAEEQVSQVLSGEMPRLCKTPENHYPTD